MLDSYFLPYQQLLIVSAFFFYIISVFFFEFSKKQSLALFFLLAGTLIFKIFVITADEFINLWDEQFHALVAKNMSHDFFTPKLYPDPILPYNYKEWTDNYIWVHKQPWFLMQMAVFIKLMGNIPFAVRLPSVLCFTFAVFCIYKIGENTLTKRIGFAAALLFSMNYFFNDMLVGSEPTDHNDIVFMCYVVASVWAFTEYLKNPPSSKWLLLIASFCSFAVLTKWLPGYLVFGIWFIYLITDTSTSFVRNRKVWLDFFKTLGMSLILPAAWQIYIYARFPVEAAYEHSFNVQHITMPLEGHGGDAFYHLNIVSLTIGTCSAFFILAGILFLNKYIKDKRMYFGYLFSVAIVFLFFTYVATKMPGFTFIVYFIIFLGFGALAQALYDYLKLGNNLFKRLAFCGLIIYCCVLICNLERFQKNHTFWKKKEFGILNFRTHNIDWRKTCCEIESELKKEKYVIFNCDPIDHVKLMFYTDYIGYSIIPGTAEMAAALAKGYKLAIMDNGKLPPQIVKNKNIKKIKNSCDRVISRDTVVMKLSDGKFLHISTEGKLQISPDNPSPIIVTSFANNKWQLKNLNGKIATARVDEGGLLVFEKDIYEIYEQFYIESKNGQHTITTIFNEDLVIPAGEKSFFTKRHETKSLTVEFIPYK